MQGEELKENPITKDSVIKMWDNPFIVKAIKRKSYPLKSFPMNLRMSIFLMKGKLEGFSLKILMNLMNFFIGQSFMILMKKNLKK